VSQSLPVVSIVDDDPSFLKAVSRMLRAAGYAVRTFPSAGEFLAQTSDAPGCLIADLRMPGLSGLDLQAALARDPQAPPVIFLTGQGDIATTVRAMRQGAEDFLTKDSPKATLLLAVERAFDRDARQRAERVRMQELRGRFDTLTPREREVLQHVVQGRLNKQIASNLGISERMVKLHRTAITTKVQVHSVAKLTRLVQDAGLFDEHASGFPKGQ